MDEIQLVGLGPQQTHPHLLALIDKELVVYRAFPCPQAQNPGHLHLRFSKVSVPWLGASHRGGGTLECEPATSVGFPQSVAA